VRLAVDPKRYPAIAVAGIDPFTKAEKSIFAAAATDGPVDVRIPRAQFADFPGTQFRLYATPSPGPAAAPALVVFYHGVPDTTPEFTDAAKLDAHLAARLVQARATGKPP